MVADAARARSSAGSRRGSQTRNGSTSTSSPSSSLSREIIVRPRRPGPAHRSGPAPRRAGCGTSSGGAASPGSSPGETRARAPRRPAARVHRRNSRCTDRCAAGDPATHVIHLVVLAVWVVEVPSKSDATRVARLFPGAWRTGVRRTIGIGCRPTRRSGRRREGSRVNRRAVPLAHCVDHDRRLDGTRLAIHWYESTTTWPTAETAPPRLEGAERGRAQGPATLPGRLTAEAALALARYRPASAP